MTVNKRDIAIARWLETPSKRAQIAAYLAVRISAGLIPRGYELPHSSDLARTFDAGEATARVAKQHVAAQGLARVEVGRYVGNLTPDPHRRPAQQEILAWQQSTSPVEQMMADLIQTGAMKPGDGLPSDTTLARNWEASETAASHAKLRLACFPGIVRMDADHVFHVADAAE